MEENKALTTKNGANESISLTSPAKLYQQLKVKTIDDIFTSPNQALSAYRQALGPVQGDLYIKGILTIAVIDVVDFFNVGKTMGSEQITQTVEFILSDFWMLKIDDIKLCFDNAKRGKYGKVYDRMDGAVILEWLGTHFEARTGHVTGKHEAEHARHKSEALNGRYDRQFEQEKDARALHEIAAEQYRVNMNKNDE